MCDIGVGCWWEGNQKGGKPKFMGREMSGKGISSPFGGGGGGGVLVRFLSHSQGGGERVEKVGPIFTAEGKTFGE